MRSSPRPATQFLATGATVLSALGAATVLADTRDGCTWFLQAGSDLATQALAHGYARVRMYDESFEVLAALEQSSTSLDDQATIHRQRGLNYYQLGELDKARHHLLLAIESGRLPIDRRSRVYHTLMLVDFERGDYAEAAAHAERSREDYFATDCVPKDEQRIAKADLWHAM